MRDGFAWITTYEIWVNEFDSKTTQLNPDSNVTIWFAVEIISYISTDELKGLSNEWFIRHNTWWRFCKWGCKKSGFNHGGNFVVKRAQDGVVLGWVTSREVLVLHLYEHHLEPMSAKCSIHSHERWVPMNHYSWITSQWVWLKKLHSWILIAISQFDLLWKISPTY